jgi:hypothetical protein
MGGVEYQRLPGIGRRADPHGLTTVTASFGLVRAFDIATMSPLPERRLNAVCRFHALTEPTIQGSPGGML